MDPRSPITLLGAIVDEVEGLRRVDPKSHLPNMLMIELRACLDQGGMSGASNTTVMLSDIEDLAGRTVSKVFDGGLDRGDIAILCSDGSFVVLQAEGDDEDPYITTLRNLGSIDNHLSPRQRHEAGLMSLEQMKEAEREKQIAMARRALAQAEARAAEAKASLERLTGPA